MKSEEEKWMEIALDEAEKAYAEGEVPVGAVIAGGEGGLLSRAHNLTVSRNDPTAHAEILAIRKAASKVGNYRLSGATLYVTVEPCCMCAGAVIWSRLDRLVYGASDPKGGAAGSLYQIPQDERLNHRAKVTVGVLEDDCRKLMQRFFRMRRSSSASNFPVLKRKR